MNQLKYTIVDGAKKTDKYFLSISLNPWWPSDVSFGVTHEFGIKWVVRIDPAVGEHGFFVRKKFWQNEMKYLWHQSGKKSLSVWKLRQMFIAHNFTLCKNKGKLQALGWVCLIQRQGVLVFNFFTKKLEAEINEVRLQRVHCTHVQGHCELDDGWGRDTIACDQD